MQVRLEGQTRLEGQVHLEGQTRLEGQAQLKEQAEGAAMMKRKFQYSIREMTIRLLKIAAPVKAPLRRQPLQVLWEISHMGLMGFGALGPCLRGQAGLKQSCAVWGIDGSLYHLIVACRYVVGVASPMQGIPASGRHAGSICLRPYANWLLPV